MRLGVCCPKRAILPWVGLHGRPVSSGSHAAIPRCLTASISMYTLRQAADFPVLRARGPGINEDLQRPWCPRHAVRTPKDPHGGQRWLARHALPRRWAVATG